MLERRNPVPPGRYWLDIFGPNIATFTAFTRANKNVRVVSSEFFDSDVPSQKRQWVLFDVTSPVQFDQVTFGFPTIVKGTSAAGTIVNTNVATSADTVDRGTDTGLLDDIARGLNLSPELAALLPVVALGVGALFIASVIKRK